MNIFNWHEYIYAHTFGRKGANKKEEASKGNEVMRWNVHVDKAEGTIMIFAIW